MATTNPELSKQAQRFTRKWEKDLAAHDGRLFYWTFSRRAKATIRVLVELQRAEYPIRVFAHANNEIRVEPS